MGDATVETFLLASFIIAGLMNIFVQMGSPRPLLLGSE
jgi:hypothetical protein